MSTHQFNPSPEPIQPPQYQQPVTPGQQPLPPPTTRPQSGSPAIDVIDNEHELWIYIDLPGFRERETKLRGDENTLVVYGERIDELEEGRSILARERPNQVDRTIQLPVSVDPNEAEASFEDGVCKVVLPKVASERLKEIRFD